ADSAFPLTINGTSNPILVSANAATHFLVSTPGSTTVAAAFPFTVTAQDQFNNTATSYAGLVHFTSSDGAAILPANSPLTSGTGTFSARMENVGIQTITAADTINGLIAGTSNAILVNSSPTTTTIVSSLNPSLLGQVVTFTITVAPNGGVGTP